MHDGDLLSHRYKMEDCMGSLAIVIVEVRTSIKTERVRTEELVVTRCD